MSLELEMWSIISSVKSWKYLTTAMQSEGQCSRLFALITQKEGGCGI